MKFLRLHRPDPSDSVQNPQCSAEIVEPPMSYFLPRADRERNRKRARVLGFDPQKCQHRSSYSVDGTPYCTKHAEKLALQQVMRDSSEAKGVGS